MVKDWMFSALKSEQEKISTLTTFIQHHSHYSLQHALFSLDSVVALSSYFKKSEATSTEVPQIPLYNYIFILISILLYILLSLEGLEI